MTENINYLAPHINHKISNATVLVPGSKSETNRILLLSAISNMVQTSAESSIILREILNSRDSALMIGALEALGAKFEFLNPEKTDVRVTAMDSWSSELAVNWCRNDSATGNDSPKKATIFCGLAGTVMRFVPVIAAFFDGEVLIDGDPESYVRPMKPLIDGLRSLGIKVDDEKNPGYLPFKVYGNPNLLANTHQKVSIDSSSSSQFVSAFLLASPLFTNGLTVKLAPPAGSTDGALKVPSLPHIEMSVAAIAKFGVETEFINTEKNIEWTTKISNNKTANTAENPAEINAPSNKQTSNLNTAKQLTIEPDLSNAGVFMASVLANPLGGQITIKNWPADSIQPGAMMREIIEIIGADCGTVVAHNPETLDLTVVSNGLFSLDNFNATDWQHLNLSLAGELTPVIAALIALRVYITSYKTKDQITAKITGIAHLRGHETDRIKALVTELNKVFEPVENTGVQVISSELADGIQICGKFVPEKDGSSTLETVPDEKNSAQTVPDEKKSAQPVPNKIEKNVPNKILVDTYKDHRMVMFAAVLGLAIPEITKYQSEILIENVGTVAKTLPDFTSMWEKLISK